MWERLGKKDGVPVLVSRREWKDLLILAYKK